MMEKETLVDGASCVYKLIDELLRFNARQRRKRLQRIHSLLKLSYAVLRFVHLSIRVGMISFLVCPVAGSDAVVVMVIVWDGLLMDD